MGPFIRLSFETGSFSCSCNPHRFLQPEVFKALFPCTGTLDCTVCLTPQLFLPVYLHANVGPPGPVAAASPALVSHLPPCHVSSPPGLPVSTTLDECFFFSSLVVGLPYSLILWQFWLFFVFKLVVVLLLVVRGGKVYLPMPLFWWEVKEFS